LPELGGVVGVVNWIYFLPRDYLGKQELIGTNIWIDLSMLFLKLKVSPDRIKQFFENTKKRLNQI
jgi:hypothetical protein